MGVLYDYFRAAGDDAVRRRLDERDGGSPVPRGFPGADLKGIDPTIALGKLVGFATGREWAPGLVGEQLIWPAGAQHNLDHEGPWVTRLDDAARDALAAIPAEQAPELAGRWARIEEFYGGVDAEDLREVLARVVALAAEARAHGESLYVWCAL
ncbi:hypothetical protein [Actinoplanes siamensis]|uniref:DUF1877 family protein n=1 Tax=Actinoplanes siamensis TaxID=1223317 RepID=A0A919TIN3_9ACTN|nr:hypothetical protein [Actinoplanes siamensis]GIF03880.1 hypothetical protein Asi03nite_14180 [Actinoplanes siamensis]